MALLKNLPLNSYMPNSILKHNENTEKYVWSAQIDDITINRHSFYDFLSSSIKSWANLSNFKSLAFEIFYKWIKNKNVSNNRRAKNEETDSRSYQVLFWYFERRIHTWWWTSYITGKISWDFSFKHQINFFFWPVTKGSSVIVSESSI